jgi:hypothetical protein
MPARGGDWTLLKESSDPVVADTDVVQELVTYYKTIADEITSESDVLRKIGEGEDTRFKGKTADAVRSKSGEVAESLQKMSGRYLAVRDALTAYLPELHSALDESAAALKDAEAASSAGTRAGAMADPSQGRADDAPPLTDDEQGQVDAKNKATSEAKGDADAAVARLQRALGALNGAGEAAANTIRGAWDDGLHDTGWDKFKAFFAKILKLIVKIFTYIGIALAALAILIPGVGVLAIMGAVAAGVALVAQVGLAVVGEGNVLDLVMAVVGVVTLGIGSGITKATSIAVKAGVKAGKSAIPKALTNNLEQIDKFRNKQIGEWLAKTKGPVEADEAVKVANNAEHGVTSNAIAKYDEFVGKFADNPNWWNIPKIGTTIKNDWKTISTQFGSDLFTRKGFTGWAERLGGVDGQINRNALAKWGPENGFGFNGFTTQAPKWHTYANGGMSAFGKQWTNAGLIVNPSMIGSDTKRPWSDDWAARKHPIPAIPEPPGYGN